MPNGVASLELGHTLVLKRLAYPTEPSDAANKQFVFDQQEVHLNSKLNLNNNRITNIADPVNEQDTATKRYTDSLQAVYVIYKATFSSERITAETKHLGGKDNLNLLVDDTIRLSDFKVLYECRLLELLQITQEQ